MTSAAGTDIVAVERVGRLISKSGQSFLARWFTADEVAYCNGKARPSLHFAARLAAKEAVLKALGCSWDGPIPWADIEIGHDHRGVPVVTLSGRVLASARQAGVEKVQVSLSHCDAYATAVAIAEVTDVRDAG